VRAGVLRWCLGWVGPPLLIVVLPSLSPFPSTPIPRLRLLSPASSPLLLHPTPPPSRFLVGFAAPACTRIDALPSFHLSHLFTSFQYLCSVDEALRRLNIVDYWYDGFRVREDVHKSRAAAPDIA